MELSIDLFLDILKLNIILLDVDVAISEKSADLLDIGWSYLVVAVSPCHGFRQSDERLQLPNCDLVGRFVLGLLSLSDHLVLFLEDLCGLPGELRVDCPAKLNVSLHLLHFEEWVASLIPQTMHVDDVLGDIVVFLVVFLVENYEEDVETGHDWS
jgi:hypothetical protein